MREEGTMWSCRKRQLATYAVLVFSIPLLYGGCNPCGNGTLQPDKGEECDDGNTLPIDGCDPTCKIEDPTSCVPSTTSVLLSAAAKDPQWTTLYQPAIAAAGLNLSGLTQVYECSEGNGPTSFFG